VYIALSQSSPRKLIEGGLPADKITVKSNFAHPDPGPGTYCLHEKIVLEDQMIYSKMKIANKT
jgi:hypothetical protein